MLFTLCCETIMSIPTRTFNRYHKTTADSIQKAMGTNISASNPNFFDRDEVMNAANGYLLVMLQCIERYTLSSRLNTNGDHTEKAFFLERLDIIRSLFNMLAPKIRDKLKDDGFYTFRNRMKELHTKTMSMYKYTDEGVQIKKNSLYNLSFEIDELYQDLLVFIDQIGMLTKKMDDPMKSFGDYSD